MNKELLLLLILITIFIRAGASILLGAIKAEKDTTYGLADVFMGLVNVGLGIWVLIS